MKFKKKISVKAVILIVLAVGLLVGGVGYLSKGFDNMNVVDWIYEKNPQNLLSYETDVEIRDDSGIITTVNEYGAIKIKGYIPKNEDDVKFTYSLGTVELKAGTYTLSTVEKMSSNSKVMVYGILPDGSVWQADSTSKMTQTFEEDVNITFGVNVYVEDCEIDVSLRPVLNEGDKPLRDFLVKRTVNKD